MSSLDVEKLLKKESLKLKKYEEIKYRTSSIINKEKISGLLLSLERFDNALIMLISFFLFVFIDKCLLSNQLASEIFTYLFFSALIVGLVKKIINSNKETSKIQVIITVILGSALLFLLSYIDFLILFTTLFFSIIILYLFKFESRSLIRQESDYFKNSLNKSLLNLDYLKDLESLFRKNIFLQEKLLDYGSKLKEKKSLNEYYERQLFDHLFYVLYNDSRNTEKIYLKEYLEISLNMNKNKIKIIN